MWTMLSVVPLFILFLAASDAHQGDAPCLRKAGLCQDPSEDCNLGEYMDAPACGENGIKRCCVKFESDRQCRKKGGICQEEGLRCDGGRYVESLFCKSGLTCCLAFQDGDCGLRYDGAVCAGENDFSCKYGVKIENAEGRCDGPDSHCCMPFEGFHDPKCYLNAQPSPLIPDGAPEVTIHFHNKRGDTATIIYLDPEGNEMVKTHVMANKHHKVASHPGQNWMFRDPSGDIIYYNRGCQYTASDTETQNVFIDYTL